MFSPPVNGFGPDASARSSRRRPRPLSSEGSISQPKAKRQRSALSKNTFTAPDAAPEMQEVKPTTLNTSTLKHESTRPLPPQRHELTVRGKKPKAGERGNKDDGSVVLTTNDTYTVSRLPSWPERLQIDPAGPFQGAVYSNTGYALALTHSHALVWPYATNTASPETFTFALPHPSKHVSDALPLGSLVSSSASSLEPGLVVVMPHTGKVTYWESIASAATLDLIKLKRNGVELSIPGMLSGERVSQILNAEPAGFMLSFTSGRLAHMSVRDGQGRPAIGVSFLRVGGPALSTSIFGSLRNVLSSSVWRGDLAAVRAAPPSKPGERDVVTVTSKGRLQSWNFHRGGHHSLHAESDAREPVVTALKRVDPSLADLLLESFEVLDLALVPKIVVAGNSDVQQSPADNNEKDLLLLTSLTGKGTCRYALVQVTLKPDSLSIGRIRQIRTYTTPVNREVNAKPRLYLPHPMLVAFVVFDRAVVISSMATPPDSPDLQLLAESHMPTEHFEDTIDFREDSAVEITGTGMEEPNNQPHSVDENRSPRFKAKYPAIVLLVRGGGAIRVAATNPHKFAANIPIKVTAKSKLEQAVFYGTLENNPLSFNARPELQFSAKEISQAALLLSHEILSSTTTLIPSLPITVDENLQRRSKTLQVLMTHLKNTKVELDRVTRWKLLWDAEKLIGATIAWNRYDSLLKEKPAGEKRSLWNDIVDFIHERHKSQAFAEAGELDRVRHWFINDIWRLEIALPWAFQAVKYTYQDGDKDHGTILSMVSEADDFVSGTLDAAFTFRMNNLGLYGLSNENIENGILIAGYEDLPQFWTSTTFVADNLRKLTDLAGSFAHEYWTNRKGAGQPQLELVNKVRLENVSLVDLCCRSNTERFRWCLAQDSPTVREEGAQAMSAYFKIREVQISRLGEIGLVDEAIELAEKHHAYPILVALVIEEMQKTRDTQENLRNGETDAGKLASRGAWLGGLVDNYYKLFGRDWAEALYTYYIEHGELFALITDNNDHQDYLTNYLRSKKEFAKVAWIHEVGREKNFDRAAKELLELGLRREQDLWSKKVELSVGKLARLAGRKYSEAAGLIIPDGGEVELSETTNQLALIQIQDKIFKHVHRAIATAVDKEAEMNLALGVYANEQLDGKDALAGLLREKLNWLLEHKAMGAPDLIDLLTLLGSNKGADEQGPISEVDGLEFYLALEALRVGSSDIEERLTERVIWRRCMLRDDWVEINNTDLKDDDHVSGQLQQTALYSTLRACFQNRIFEKPSTLKPVRPRDVLGAGTEELGDRFRGLDAGIREPLLKDMKAEDSMLKEYMGKCRLEKWFEGILDLAKRSVEEEANRQTESGQLMKEAAVQLQAKEEEIASTARQAALDSLRSKGKAKVNGSVTAFRSSVKMY